MKKFLPVIGCVAALSLVLIVSGQAGRQAQPVAPTADAVATQKALVGQYCVTCHSDKAKSAGMSWIGVSNSRRNFLPDTSRSNPSASIPVMTDGAPPA